MDCSLEITSSIWLGTVIGLTILNAGKVIEQTLQIYSKIRSFTSLYSWMIVGLLLANISQAVIDWLYIRGDVAGSLGFSGAGTVLWIIQTQRAPQIIANRLGLIIANKRKTKIMKITLFTIVGIMNIFVMSVMFPMQATRPKLGLRIQRFYSPIDKILTLKISLIVVVFLSNPYLYASIHPTVYSIKLAIEMMMADFIARVVQEQHQIQEI
ncbi:hypothetical protein JMJ77_0001483 [Colletotrichum scovillei]|uniref:Uncharacterized protein n=1 Tax=Colletotrichum scovillei TaxID=1209932 RepID=A0A9P7UFZ8_9PEZI|nr:hypothetical protein JMJ77_0001483 [Colletotrichum scovillei]